MYQTVKCPYCGTPYSTFSKGEYVCHRCSQEGDVVIFLTEYPLWKQEDINRAFSYVSHNKNGKIFTLLESEDKCREAEKQSQDTEYISKEKVDAWYPRTFAQKIDYILLYFAEHMKYDGEAVAYTLQMLKSLFFAKTASVPENDVSETKQQVVFILNYLCKEGYIEPTLEGFGKDFFSNPYVQMSDYEAITLTPKALARVDELQKTLKDTKQVFIAMSFDESLDKANEAIQKAISENGYFPRRMDEYKHNNQIVPEMLYQIRQSKFVVADLTGHNNGAYYEAGYASGIGKEVILTCKHDSFASDSHFDVKQQATVIWENEDDLKNKLTTWIEATIGKAY